MIPIQTALLRLVLALVLGACVGFERERGERGAGLRTHALVALGSSLIMIVSAFGFSDLQGVSNVSLDPSRIAAQVVSGIGFLGAGTILLRKEIVTGLTTAAAIWVVAGIGLACGAGLLLEALAVTIFTIAILALLKPLGQRVPRLPEMSHLRIKVTAESMVLTRVYDICREIGATLEQVEVQTGSRRDKLEIVCATSEAVRLTKSLVALRTESGTETISINLRNPNTNMDLFPLTDDEPTTEDVTP